MSLLTAITRVQAIVGALSGIKGAPSVITDNINDFPFVVAYPGKGSWEAVGFGTTMEDSGEIVIDLHAGPAAKGINQAVTTLLGYWETLPKAILADSNLNATISWIDFGGPALTSDGMLAMQYGAVSTYGCRWRLRYSKDEAA